MWCVQCSAQFPTDRPIMWCLNRLILQIRGVKAATASLSSLPRQNLKQNTVQPKSMTENPTLNCFCLFNLVLIESSPLSSPLACKFNFSTGAHHSLLLQVQNIENWMSASCRILIRTYFDPLRLGAALLQPIRMCEFEFVDTHQCPTKGTTQHIANLSDLLSHISYCNRKAFMRHNFLWSTETVHIWQILQLLYCTMLSVQICTLLAAVRWKCFWPKRYLSAPQHWLDGGVLSAEPAAAEGKILKCLDSFFLQTSTSNPQILKLDSFFSFKPAGWTLSRVAWTCVFLP